MSIDIPQTLLSFIALLQSIQTYMNFVNNSDGVMIGAWVYFFVVLWRLTIEVTNRLSLLATATWNLATTAHQCVMIWNPNQSLNRLLSLSKIGSALICYQTHSCQRRFFSIVSPPICNPLPKKEPIFSICFVEHFPFSWKSHHIIA